LSGLKIAVVGCGFIGTIHSFALRALIRGGLVEAAVISACDLDSDKAVRLIEAHGEGVATADVEEALDGADAAWICTPTSSHKQVVEHCVDHGVAIYCEKPLATDLSGAEEIFGLVDKAGVANQVGLVLRSSPPVAQLAALCRGEPVSGGPSPESMGRPIAAFLRDDQYFPIGGMYGSEWRADFKTAGGGTLIEHSIHDVDLLSWMFGPVVSLTARTANHAGHAGIEDVAALTLEHETGVTTQLLSVWHGLRTRPSTRRLEVFFDKAHSVLEDESAGPVRIEQAEQITEVGMPEEALSLMAGLPIADGLKTAVLAYVAADLGFVRSVLLGSRPAPGLDVAVDAHRVVDAAYRSAGSGGIPEALDRSGTR
jgi:myo-inositol 2-dehydrogenase / D-chiro-inositol 1-dehydrogenase